MARIRAAAAVGTLLGAALLGAPVASADPGAGVLNVAHRGASARAPEHTLAAVDWAVADHADRLSIDVRLTRDDVPVVLHDDGLDRTTDVEQRFPAAASWSVRDFTLAQVRTLDAGSWFGSGRFSGSRVLTLDELLTELGGSPVGLTVEAKSPQTAEGVDGIGDAIMAVFGAHPEWTRRGPGGVPRLVVESFRWAFLDGLHAAYPRQPLVLLGDRVVPGDLTAHPYAAEVDVNAAHLTPALLATAHRRGIRVGVYTVNGRSAIRQVVAGGADAVTSDQPADVRSVLAVVRRVWTGTLWPTASPVQQVRLWTSPTVGVRGRVSVRARLVEGAGRPARWHRVRFETLVAGRWTVVGRRATGSAGTAEVSLPVRPGLQVRAVASGRVSVVRSPLFGR